MDNKISTYSPAFSIVSWIALVGGIVTYLLGLWNAEMQLNEKGYYFAVLVLGLFSAAHTHDSALCCVSIIPIARPNMPYRM
jgi:uncharacterized membrane protein YiaA